MQKQFCSTLVLTLTLLCLPLRAAPQDNTSQTEKAKKCEETAKKRGLKGDDRAAFVSSCMAAKDTADATMSPQEKAKADNAQSCETAGYSEGSQRQGSQGLYENLRRGCPQAIGWSRKS
jgi:psiF repeat